MPSRSQIQAFLVSSGLPAWAESAPHLAGAEKIVAIYEARIEAVRQVIAGGYQHMVNGRPVNPLKNGELCDHGRAEWQDCIGCYDEALLAALDGFGEGGE